MSEDINAVVDSYIAAWNATDTGEREQLVAKTFADEGAGYVDPLMKGDGQAQITAMIGAAQQQFPGHRFELSARADAHNDRVRFAWDLISPEGTKVAAGVDFATVSDDGRLQVVTGFLEPVA